jgi:alanyl-tRNA synthetase
VLPGDVAFRLHDTYGFPVDLTVDMAAEYGVRVDREGFAAAMAEQKERSRKGTKADLSRHAELGDLYQAILRRAGETKFLGYDGTEAEARVVAILRDGMEYQELTGNGEAEVVLDATPFYGEGGGQVGDRGEILEAGGGSALFTVEDTQKPIAGLFVHRGKLHGRIKVGETVTARVDAERRARTMRNHTATHLLHRALRNVVGPEAHQAGSLVAPDYLRFDYPLDRPLSPRTRSAPSRTRSADRPREPPGHDHGPGDGRRHRRRRRRLLRREVRRAVRTVRVEGYSLELCGGTHCSASGQIGSFVITADRSIGAGTRRIEAVTGDGADALIRERLALLDRIAEIGRRHLRRGRPGARGGSPGRAQGNAPPAQGRRQRPAQGRRRWPPGAKEVAPGVKLVAHSERLRVAGAVEELRQGDPCGARVGRDRRRLRRRGAADLRHREPGPGRAWHFGRRARQGRDDVDGRPRRRPSGDGARHGYSRDGIPSGPGRDRGYT